MPRRRRTTRCRCPAGASFGEILDLWRPIAHALDDVADTIGGAHLYPIRPVGLVVDKLADVHARVRAAQIG